MFDACCHSRLLGIVLSAMTSGAHRETELRRALMGVGKLSDWVDGPATRLGGMTNFTYRVEGPYPVCVRIAGAGTSAYIDRQAEAETARAASAAGISPELLHVDPASGLLVSRFLDHAITMTPHRFRNMPGTVALAARALRRLHDSDIVMGRSFSPLGDLETYLENLRSRGAAPPERLLAAIEVFLAEFRYDAAGRPARPCHCDPTSENFLLDGNRMLLIDWEYSGTSDPLWDLADLSVEADFNTRQDKVLLDSYSDRPVEQEEVELMAEFKILCDLMWSVWSHVQHVDGNRTTDYLAYARGRTERAIGWLADRRRVLPRALRSGGSA